MEHKPSKRDQERIWAAQAADRSLSPQDAELWHSCRYVFRSHCHFNKIFVIWHAFDDAPNVLDTLTVCNLEADSYDGFGLRVENSKGESLWITHEPTRLWSYNLFAHVPFLGEFTFLPKTETSNPSLKVPIVVKSLNSPCYPLVEGCVYMTQLSEFRATYPQFKNVKL